MTGSVCLTYKNGFCWWCSLAMQPQWLLWVALMVPSGHKCIRRQLHNSSSVCSSGRSRLIDADLLIWPQAFNIRALMALPTYYYSLLLGGLIKTGRRSIAITIAIDMQLQWLWNSLSWWLINKKRRTICSCIITTTIRTIIIIIITIICKVIVAAG